MSTNKQLLSEKYMITGNYEGSDERFLNKISKAIDHGIRMLQLRIKNVELDIYDELAKQVSEICARNCCCLILNRPPSSKLNYKFNGFHITSKQLMSCNSLDHQLREIYTISAPIHNEQELIQANKLGLNFGIITPVKQSISYPDAKFLGWQKARELAAQAKLPLYAAGGLSEDDLESAKMNGFIGVATLGATWLKSLS